jgi:ABC-type Zn2+ transport system substrate-binding protein/surface adhesin
LIATVLSGHELNSIVVDLLGSNLDNAVTSSENGYSKFIANIADDFYECLYE